MISVKNIIVTRIRNKSLSRLCIFLGILIAFCIIFGYSGFIVRPKTMRRLKAVFPSNSSNYKICEHYLNTSKIWHSFKFDDVPTNKVQRREVRSSLFRYLAGQISSNYLQEATYYNSDCERYKI